MSDAFVPVEHREEVQVRAVEEGEVVHTLAGPQYPTVGQFVVRRRNVGANLDDIDVESLRSTLADRGQDSEGDRDALIDRLFPWEDRVADGDYVAYHFKVEDAVESQEVDADTYWDGTVSDLRAEIDKRNEGRDEDDKIVPESPGNKPELVAALEADDASNDG